MSLKLGSNQITPIQVKNIINNQSYKTIVPNKNTQIIAPDIVYKPFDNISINLQENTTTGISYNSSNYFNLSIPKYVRLNGTMDIDWSSNNTNISTVISFSNCILTRGASYMGPDTGFRISSQQSGMSISGNINAWTSGPINRIEIFKAEGKIHLTIFFDSQYSTIYLSLINFTLELSDDITFSNNYDGMDQLTIQSIPSDYIIPEGTISISAPGTYDISSFASINIPGTSSPTWTTTRISDAAKIVYSITITNGFNSKSQSFSSYTYFPVKSAATIIPSEISQIVVNQYNWTTGSVIVDAIPNSIQIYKKIIDKTVNIEEANEFLSSQTTVPLMGFWSCQSLIGELNLSNITYIGSSAFDNCRSITAVNAPNVTSIGPCAFSYCNNLTTINMPNLLSVSNYAFNQCNKLTSFSFPILESGAAQWLSLASTVSTVYLPNLKYNPCLSYLYYVKTFDLPELLSLNAYAFYNTSRVTTFNLPKLNSINGGSIFAGCSSLSYLQLPALTYMSGTSIFISCSILHTLSFPQLQSWSGSNAIANCPNLMSIYLMNSSMVKLIRSDIITNQSVPFVNSALTGSFGSFYVPSSLLTTYQNDSMWSWWSSRIVGI